MTDVLSGSVVTECTSESSKTNGTPSSYDRDCN